MSRGSRRLLADLCCDLLGLMLPRPLRSWARAVRCETAAISDDGEALRFAFGSLCGLVPHAVSSFLSRFPAAPTGGGPLLSEGPIPMKIFAAMIRRPQGVGIACAVGAIILGLAYMAAAGAPSRYLAINAGALMLGLALLPLLAATRVAGGQGAGGALMAMAAALFATALFGNAVDGAARWVKIGSLAVQPSLVLLPLMLATFAQLRSTLATVALVIAAGAMALQPDRGMAGVLALTLAALTILRRDRHVVAALCAALVAFGTTLVRGDSLPAVPHVDRILYTSFEVHPAAGAAVLAGSCLLLVPAIVGWAHDRGSRAIYASFGTAWFAAILAAALGNYPTPIVGYGGSAVIGYVLSLLALPRLSGDHAASGQASRGGADAVPLDAQLRMRLA